jgi:hypothetical protein
MNAAASLSIAALVLVGTASLAGSARAHCDSIDGPVVAVAREALRTRRPEPALIWVTPADEPEIRKVFAQTLRVRRLGTEARELADMHFFETLVRIHRAGEGAPYTGLKPPGAGVEPAIAAADEALRSGDVEALAKLLADEVARGLRERFRQVRALARYEPHDVAAGRRFVAAYVAFIHYAEAVHASAGSARGAAHEH